MKRLLLVLLLVPLISFGQNDGYELCFEIGNRSFNTNKDATEALQKVLSVANLKTNRFVILPCDNIGNAMAAVYEGFRYILYKESWLSQSNYWSKMAVLAHEVGHHINGHTLSGYSLSESRRVELEADDWAGYAMGVLGASLTQTLELTKRFPDGDDSNSGIEEGNEDGNDNSSAGGDTADNSDDAGDDAKSSEGSEVGGNATSSAPAGVPEAKTDTALKDGLKSLADGNATEKVYARIPKVDSSKFIVDYKTVVAEMGDHYGDGSDDTWIAHSLNEVKEFKNDSKKTVAYMVKEFEMKKSADQYARAATSKTGTLDMGALHTYKFNDDLFKKVTTLPGATNHGMVMVVDWSGSMCDNLKGTIEQLLQLVMFCRRTKIPFEVFAFTSCYNRNAYSNSGFVEVNYGEITISNDMRLLNFFSSKMSAADEEKMMHYVWMIAKRYGRQYENWKETGYPINPPSSYSLGGTPLNDAIIALMDFLPKYKKASGVQKINTIFLTDGASQNLIGVKDVNDRGDFYQGFGKENLLIDSVTNKRYEAAATHGTITNVLLKALKGRVYDMNVVGFFLAGSGRNGAVKRNTWWYILRDGNLTTDQAMAKMRKDKVVMLDSKGYDQYFILPGGGALSVENGGLDDDLTGASKAKLKTAFAKSNKGRIQSRVLLNKFVALVA